MKTGCLTCELFVFQNYSVMMWCDDWWSCWGVDRVKRHGRRGQSHQKGACQEHGFTIPAICNDQMYPGNLSGIGGHECKAGSWKWAWVHRTVARRQFSGGLIDDWCRCTSVWLCCWTAWRSEWVQCVKAIVSTRQWRFTVGNWARSQKMVTVETFCSRIVRRAHSKMKFGQHWQK